MQNQSLHFVDKPIDCIDYLTAKDGIVNSKPKTVDEWKFVQWLKQQNHPTLPFRIRLALSRVAMRHESNSTALSFCSTAIITTVNRIT